ncbi:MAG: aconitate hydratase [Tannerellaceae bacterium]|nr:aconitate hydratase [Tannerellaceae bacterium]
MKRELETIANCYGKLVDRVKLAHEKLKRPLTLAEKILYAHVYKEEDIRPVSRGETYMDFRPDRVAMQDATAQMALLQFMNAGQKQSAVPASVHCDHLIQAWKGAGPDMETALRNNQEVYDFLRTASAAYGIEFWKPGAGIIHQVVFENYAFPGGMMVGTDSHTPNAGGMGMIAIGVGGADAVDVMTGMEWELKMPALTGVRLTGQLSGWATPKDVILKLTGLLTVKGGTNTIIEYFGEGTSTLSATGKATICNMGAEVGATTSVFPYDEEIAAYLKATGREEIARMADEISGYLQADPETAAQPEKYYDRVIEIDLSTLEPYVNGPFTPDAATPLSQLKEKVQTMGYPQQVEVGLIGSCTNSSYQDLTGAASLAQQAIDKQLPLPAQLVINPGSEKIRATAARDGVLAPFEKLEATLMANACGPCIGQWKRETADKERPNTIITSFNRNFAKRADGNPNTHAFVASPEMVMAFSIAGDLCFNPLTDKLKNRKGEWVRLDPPVAQKLPAAGFTDARSGCIPPSGEPEEILIAHDSQRLQRLSPFEPWDGNELYNLALLIKVKGKCTTDHISMAGPWLRYRGHLENISENLLMGAVNAFNLQTNSVNNPLDGGYEPVSTVAKALKEAHIPSIIVAEDNYGEGSSREHAAMEPRFLNVRVILAKSFARIHETNLKKQGMLALTFENPADYNRIRELDRISITGLTRFTPGVPLHAIVLHTDGTTEAFHVLHTYNEVQIEWFRAGSALNYNAKKGGSHA